jgi:hypothetical protein
MADTALRRPVGVSIIAILLIVGAIGDIIFGSLLFFSSFGENPTYTNALTGESQTVSTFYLWFAGGITVILGLIYIWLAKLAWVGSETAHVVISALAVLNIIFGFFNLGHGGWLQIIIGLIVVLIVNTQSAMSWFRQNP